MSANGLFSRVQTQSVGQGNDSADLDPLSLFSMESSYPPTPPPSSSTTSSSTSVSTPSRPQSINLQSGLNSDEAAQKTATSSSFPQNFAESFSSITDSGNNVGNNNSTLNSTEASSLSMPSIKSITVNKVKTSSVRLTPTSQSEGPIVASVSAVATGSANASGGSSLNSNHSGNISVKATSSGNIVSGNGIVVSANGSIASTRPASTASNANANGFSNGGGVRSSPIENIPLGLGLTGEVVDTILDSSFLQVGKKSIEGTTYITNYRVYFHVSSISSMKYLVSISPSMYSYLSVPLGCIEKIEKERRLSPKDHNTFLYIMTIYCKDIRRLTITLQGKLGGKEDNLMNSAITSIQKVAFCSNIRKAFAFSHALPSEPLSIVRIEPYDIKKEFDRQGIMTRSNSFLRYSTANNKFQICSSYPSLLVVPMKIEDRSLAQIANFRSGGRLPVLSWGDKHNGATIWRCSQPKTGLAGNTCEADEKYLNEIAISCSTRKDPLGNIKMTGKPLLHIVDCRPKASAYANLVAGAGYESGTNYQNCNLEFYNIGNIHVMRDSLKGIKDLALNPKPDSDDVNFSKQIESTEWLSHVRWVLRASLETALLVRKGIPCLVHCSHGWDRTAQVCSLSQLFLDSYFRTMEGFKVLVEKEFNSYGHQFNLRCQHLKDKANREEDQVSPIFLQFLDCVWQIVKQYPQYFEFNSRYILTVADHIYSCRFGTFLFNEEKDRAQHNVWQCVDLWTYLHYNRKSFLNPLFLDPNDEDNNVTTHVLLPNMSQLLRGVTIWSDYYFRYSPMNSNHSAPEHLQKYLHQEGRSNPLGKPLKFTESLFTEEFQNIINVLPDFHLCPVATFEDTWESVCRVEWEAREKRSGENVGDATLTFNKEKDCVIDKVNIADILLEKDESIERQQDIIARMAERLKSLGVSEEEIEAFSYSSCNSNQNLNDNNNETNSQNLILQSSVENSECISTNKYLLDDDYDKIDHAALKIVANDDEIPILTSSPSRSVNLVENNLCISPEGKTYVIVDDDIKEETEGEFL